MKLPNIGMRFEHKRILNQQATAPAVCEISRIAKGVIYYRVNGEKKASEYVAIERWPAVFGRAAQ